jgi:hypothetical protein
MNLDISDTLSGWPYQEQELTVRLVTGDDGAARLQLRLDVGVLQMELEGRPDGLQLNGHKSWLDHLERKLAEQPSSPLDDNDWSELDREIMQFYQRRIALLAVAQAAEADQQHTQALELHRRVVRDADHSLRAMDFISEHSSDQEYIDNHERYRAFILGHRTQAAARLCILNDEPEQAIEAIAAGLDRMEKARRRQDDEQPADQDPMFIQLKKLQRDIRRRHRIKRTLREQLEKAVEQEDFERAARIRDQIRRRSGRTE